MTYMPQITEVLNRVPRQMILLLKTNDLLRGIDSKLSAPKSFVTLSRCCIRAVKEHELSKCNSLTCQVTTHLQALLDQFRISLYQFSLTWTGQKAVSVLSYFVMSMNYIFHIFKKDNQN